MRTTTDGKGNRNYKQKPGRNENKMSEIKNKLEGITSRLDEAEDQISELQDKVEKKHPDRARKGKETQKE